MRKTTLLLIATIITVLGYLCWVMVLSPRNTRFIVCNVGQGDAYLFVDSNMQILFDAGREDGMVLDCLSKYMPMFDKHIELMVGSHSDGDHIGGAPEVSKYYSLGTVLEPVCGSDEQTDIYTSYKKVIGQGSQFVEQVHTGDLIELQDITVRVLWPPDANADTCERYNDNQRSYVFEFVYNNEQIMLTGDIDTAVMQTLVDTGLLAKNYYLIAAPHHGSKNSLDAEFYARTNPMQVTISAGNGNSYGHPHSDILALLDQLNIPYRRTDLEGDLVFDLSK